MYSLWSHYFRYWGYLLYINYENKSLTIEINKKSIEEEHLLTEFCLNLESFVLKDDNI